MVERTGSGIRVPHIGAYGCNKSQKFSGFPLPKESNARPWDDCHEAEPNKAVRPGSCFSTVPQTNIHRGSSQPPPSALYLAPKLENKFLALLTSSGWYWSVRLPSCNHR
jgi:hypothetical protein